MKSLNNKEDESRTQEIRMIWKQHQWLYVIIGFIIGLLFSALTQVHTIEFFLNLIPEALGISFGVFVIDRLYRHWERQRILQLIKKELISNLSLMVIKIKNVTRPFCIEAIPIRKIYGQNGMNGTLSLNHEQINLLLKYSGAGTKAGRLRTDFIESALTSDTLLLLGKVESPKEITIHEALLELRDLIDKRKRSVDILELFSKDLEQKVKYDQIEIDKIPNMYIFVPMACVDWEINIIRWSQSIIASINTGKSIITIPKLQPISPIDEFARGVFEEIPQPSEIEEWIPNWKFDW